MKEFTRMHSQRIKIVVARGYKTITRTVSNVEPANERAFRFRGTIQYQGWEFDVLLPARGRVWMMDRK